MASDKELEIILERFPPVNFAFGYGSAFFPQDGYGKEDVQYDFIFAVEDPEAWHTKNLEMNKLHYSSMMRTLGAKWIAYLQEGFGSGIYFNPFVEIDGKKIKYGVISIKALVEDLTTWKTLYVSGRLHKPVKILVHNSKVEEANNINIINAVRAALLLLPEEFSDTQLYSTITGLSYTGDVRMAVAENPHKIVNIVNKSAPKFKSLYDPILSNNFNDFVKYNAANNKYKQDISVQTTKTIVDNLPSQLKSNIKEAYNKAYKKSYENSDSFYETRGKKDIGFPGISMLLTVALCAIVRKSSFTQTAKGLLTAGVNKSVKYTYEKVAKKINAKSKKN